MQQAMQYLKGEQAAEMSFSLKYPSESSNPLLASPDSKTNFYVREFLKKNGK